jgi:glycosyltransferase involved in cell wall biosynthesis
MKILYITAELPYSTQEAFVIPELKEALQRGHEIRIVPRSPRSAVAHRDAQPLIEHAICRPLLCGEVIGAALIEAVQRPGRALKALGLVMQSGSPAILARNLGMFPKGLWAGRMARQWGATHLHAHWAATTSTIAMVASEVSGVPWSFTAHRWDIVENNLLALKVQRATLARFISRSGLNMARERGVRPDERKAHVLHMGIELPEQPDMPTVGQEPPVALCPANLVRVKGHRYLVEAFALLKQRGCPLTLQIAGDGEMRPELERQIAELGLSDSVRLLGQVSHSDLLQLYQERRVQMLVLPSIDLGNGEHEGIPVALMEGMGHGIPVVSTLTGGIPELLEGGAGLMVPPCDPPALADALECLHNAPQTRRQLVTAGRARVLEQYSIQNVMTELLAHFEAHGVRQSGVRRS